MLPQLPLSFANSCLATANTARAYFGDAARQVRPGRLAITLGLANLFGGAISGMPVCHGAGGLGRAGTPYQLAPRVSRAERIAWTS